MAEDRLDGVELIAELQRWSDNLDAGERALRSRRHLNEHEIRYIDGQRVVIEFVLTQLAPQPEGATKS